ncbi:uncharacterized protein LOC135255251 isoform X2 [Anguilla rostrata]|uniref:uncharacterized protein LOC118226972 isoform X2 n=1 Tax=Anguilla anguilla TaxID=7936 RepID=UPI0015B33034|nr:uncharacterized protein LOC118226972 isoform X2 [Anguilla anguilla]
MPSTLWPGEAFMTLKRNCSILRIQQGIIRDLGTHFEKEETASTPASVEVSDSEQEPVDRLTQAPQPPVSPIPESSRTHDEPQELDGQGRDFQRLHAAITDCGDRIVAALEPIADSFQQLTHQVGVLVEVLAKQAQVRPPCRHACPTCKCPQEQANSQEAVHHLKSEVEQFSWET